MALSVGTRVGPYEVVGKLGAGGMGEVYRAHDTKLNRDVALKVLPDRLAGDAELVARFQREALLLASLNHPNIAHIHGFEARALVLELVEGPTLAQLIARGPLPLSEAMAYARQIADALEAAHEQGVVHRDLKPANIKIRDDGTVKVLDFGLAKALVSEASLPSDPTLSPTVTAGGTQLGTILGTAAYMSPEQAKGKVADRRADIWAFGVVFLEMLTGQRVFTGETTTEVLASVMKGEPNWSRVPAGVPPPVVRLLQRCLAKDPRKRWSAIGDVKFALEDAAADRGPSGPVQDSTSGWSVRLIGLLAAGCLLLGGGVGWVISTSLSSVAPGPITRSSLLPPTDTRLLFDATSVAISPDGRAVAFITGDPNLTNTQLWIRRVDGLAARQIDGGQDARAPFWSPDSRQVAFFSKDKLKRVAADGGRVEDLCDVQDARGGTWSGRDVIVFAPSNAGSLVRVSAGGGTPEPVTTLDASRGETAHRFPEFLPDGDHFLFAALPPDSAGWDIQVGSIAGTKPEHLMRAESTPVFASGYLLFDRKGGLAAQRFDPVRRVLSGDPQPLDDIAGGVNAAFAANPAVSASDTGALAYLATPAVKTGLVWFDATGRELGQVPLSPGQYEQVQLAPDGRHAVVEHREAATVMNLWLVDLDRGGATRLTNGAGDNYFAAWSPDGTRVVYASDRDGPENIYMRPVNGSGPEARLYQSSALFKQPQSWSPDGRYVLYQEENPKTNFDLWVLPTSGDPQRIVAVQSPANDVLGRISPDGRWLGYLSDETGHLEAYVVPFLASGRKFRVTTAGASGIWWRKDSKQLLIMNTDSTAAFEADVLPGPDFSARSPKLVGRLPKGVRWVDVTPDLQRLLTLRAEGDVTLSVTLVQNWASALTKVH
jgi:serine/threonine protein kinase/Tol biopolymer transport system component